MKIQNILGALLLVIAYQSAHSMEADVHNTTIKTVILNVAETPVTFFLTYKNNTKHTYKLQSHEQISIKANPLKAITFWYENDNTAWFTPIFTSDTPADMQRLTIFSDGQFFSSSCNSAERTVSSSGVLKAQQLTEDV
jgi:hypothetical protein